MRRVKKIPRPPGPRAVWRAVRGRVRQVRLSGDLGAFLESPTRFRARIPAAHEAGRPALERFLRRVAARPGSDPFVLMFSGTIHIQKKRANRPIRLTRALARMGTSVLFSYHRPPSLAPVPESGVPRVLQVPIDRMLHVMREVIRFDLGARRRVFVLSFPHPGAVRFLDELNAHGWVTLYDVRDDWDAFARVGMARWHDPAVERHAVASADVVTAVSRPLRAKMRQLLPGTRVGLCPNGYDEDFRKDGRLGQRPATPPGKVAGYFGHLTDRWFDWALLQRAAAARPDWRFELVGHPPPDPRWLRPNLVYLGFLDHAAIGRVARGWRVGMIPFKPGPLSRAVDPIKVYEYLALGLPTVSAPMPQIADYPYVTLAAGLDEFLAGLDRSLAVRTDPARIAPWLLERTWTKRAEALLEMAARVPLEGPLKTLAPGGER